MAFDCGVFQKLKKSRPVPEPTKLSEDSTTTPSCKENSVVNSSTSPDWKEFEGVFASEFLKDSTKSSRFLMEVVNILVSYVTTEMDRGQKILDFHHPHQLREILDHCLVIHENPRDLEQILSDCKETLKYCVKTGHPRFLNQLSTGVDVIGVAGEWLTAASNTNMFTYEVAPVFTLMEDIVLQRMRQFIGWEDGDGIFGPGGAISNLYGVLLARHWMFPDAKTQGMSGTPQCVIFASEQGHYSIRRAACLLGIGSDNVIYIKCDNRGKMIPEDLKQKIQIARDDGKVPMLVSVTCGTTVLAAFDPVDEVADVCQENEIWLHVDAAWGGGALLSHEHRHLLKGIHRADSVTWNPHKMMGVPLQCSAILTRHKGLLLSANQSKAEYLFQEDKNYDVSYDTGDKTIQCGRHNDIFKLWLMWRSKGDTGFEVQVDRNFELAYYLRDRVKERETFELVLEEIEGPNVCLWYIPQKWQGTRREDIPDKELNKVAPAIKARMMETGTMLVQYQPLGKLPNFFRVAMSNPRLTTQDLDFLLDEIECLGREIQI